MNDLTDPARSALDAFKATEPGANEAIRSRTWAAIESRAAAGDLGPLLAAEQAPAAATGVAGWSPLLKGIALGVLATSVVVGAWALGRASVDGTPASVPEEVEHGVPEAEPPPEAPEAPEASPVATVAVPTVAEEQPVVDTVEPGSSAPESGQAPAAKTIKTPPSAKKPAPPAEPAQRVEEDEQDPLQAELALMSKARSALKAEDQARAVELLDEHATRFPKGTFARERDLSRIRALCELGKASRARKIAAPYLDKPGSVMATKLQGTCAAAE